MLLSTALSPAPGTGPSTQQQGAAVGSTLPVGGGGRAAQHTVQVLLQALVLLGELLHTPRQAQQGAAQLPLPFEAGLLLRRRPGDHRAEQNLVDYLI